MQPGDGATAGRIGTWIPAFARMTDSANLRIALRTTGLDNLILFLYRCRLGGVPEECRQDTSDTASGTLALQGPGKQPGPRRWNRKERIERRERACLFLPFRIIRVDPCPPWLTLLPVFVGQGPLYALSNLLVHTALWTRDCRGRLGSLAMTVIVLLVATLSLYLWAVAYHSQFFCSGGGVYSLYHGNLYGERGEFLGSVRTLAWGERLGTGIGRRARS